MQISCNNNSTVIAF